MVDLCGSDLPSTTFKHKDDFRLFWLFSYFSLIKHLYSIGLWLGEDQRTYTIKMHV